MSYNIQNIKNGYKAYLKSVWKHHKDLWTLDEYAKMSVEWINKTLREKYVFDYTVSEEEVKEWLS